jgi:hypothetical protein
MTRRTNQGQQLIKDYQLEQVKQGALKINKS